MRTDQITLGAAELRSKSEPEWFSKRVAVHRLAETMAGHARRKTVFAGRKVEMLCVSLKAVDESGHAREYAVTVYDTAGKDEHDVVLSCVKILAEQMHRDGLLTVRAGAQLQYSKCWNAQVTLKIDKEDGLYEDEQDAEVADP